MLLKQLMDIYELLDDAKASGARVKEYFAKANDKVTVDVVRVSGPQGATDTVCIRIPGRNGKMSGGTAPTLGILGRLGGIGARPERIGYVSDGDGCCAALTAAAKLADMQMRGDVLEGDVIVTTHVCPDAPTLPHEPVPFMGSPVTMQQNNDSEVLPEMDALLSIDTAKGNRVINHNGFAISNTVKSGYILRVSEDLLEIMQTVTGELPKVFPLSMQDITPYGNGIYHLNSILQPCTATDAPIVGVAITTCTAVAGCATGASHFADVESAARFAVETAKYYTLGKVQFYDAPEYELLVKRYGEMKHLLTYGNPD